jgi:hypothetical protein
MKNKIATSVLAFVLTVAVFTAPCVIMTSCSNSDAVITNAVKVAVEQTIQHVPAELQTPLADYLAVGAKAVYSIDGTPTVQELIATVLKWIPKDVQDKYPLITATITTTISLMYQTYGKSALTAIGKGIEAGIVCCTTKK